MNEDLLFLRFLTTIFLLIIVVSVFKSYDVAIDVSLKDKFYYTFIIASLILAGIQMWI